jgi:hypothetical protein
MLVSSAGVLLVSLLAADGPWKPVPGKLATPWAAKVDPTAPHPEYPRPQMVRPTWVNLNGLWNYAIRPQTEADPPVTWAGKILVPFPVESSLSGVAKPVSPKERLWYHRELELAHPRDGSRVLLHFGAADWETTVSVNGAAVGTHRGGYDPFTFDITDALRKDGTKQELVVACTDPTDANWQPRGKQVRRPEGIWYTPTTGIWQTVWLEVVPAIHIRSIRMTPDIDTGELTVIVEVNDPVAAKAANVSVLIHPSEMIASPVLRGLGEPAIVRAGSKPVRAEDLWTPDSPKLIPLKISLSRPTQNRTPRGEPVSEAFDLIDTYFAWRKISIGKDDKGVTRILLNNKFTFQFGPLDQGFWPDGLYTAPTDEALAFDIVRTKAWGFNTIRKHVKVEPLRWYHHCDRLGMIVWQDMPSGDRYIGSADPDIKRSPESAKNFENEWGAIMDALHNAPSIVMWVPFNEGWGQFDTKRIVDWTKARDPSRLVNNASGWTDRECGDVFDIHVYPGPGSPKPEPTRAAVLGEYGGLGLPLKGHTWQDEKNWGYRSFPDKDSLTRAYLALNDNLHPLIGEPGLSAAIYTQTTDVEIEVNGLMTYDRKVEKIDPKVLGDANRKLYQPPPVTRTVMPTGKQSPRVWKYSVEGIQGEAWTKPDFNDSGWREGKSGFGTRGTPGAVIGTEWNTSRILLRTTVELDPSTMNAPAFVIHHDEDVRVWINGVLAAKDRGYSTDYGRLALNPEGRKAIRKGKNVIAVECRQTGGGQYIDLGIVDIQPSPAP